MKQIASSRKTRSSSGQENIVMAMKEDHPRFYARLDNLKGSYAVEYVLQELVAKHNRHTIASVLDLIRKNRP